MDERRTVTTLFCDIVGFTALSERNDPEMVNAALRRYYGAARRVIESYGGTVEKFIGDAVVGVFGVPAAHEDDPERAVRAALRLVDEVDALPGVGGTPLEVRVGVNTGEALVNLGVDPATGEGFLTGDAVNVAARLQAAAPPMAVAVGETTHAATLRVFAFEACHPVALKGKARPLQAWIATAPLAKTGAELRTFSSAFVGREDELGALDALLAEASGQRAVRLALIVGEPGIGKSRLLAEFSSRLDDRPQPVTWRRGRCLPFGSGVTFWALSEIVRDCAGILETDGVARAEARLETVLSGDDDRDHARARLRPLVGLEAEEASRDENFAVWRTFLEAQAASGPAVLVVEDLHWADEAMLAFMDFLAESTADVTLLVLATGRPEVLEFAGPGVGFVAAAQRVALGPLTGEETGRLVLACLCAKALPVSLQARLLEASGGNPLFAEELVRLLQDRDLLVTRSGQTQLREGAELPRSDSISALIAARLDTLNPERKALLADAAVVGRTFWAGAVAAVAGADSPQVYEGLMELVAKELVRPARGSSMEGETEFVFVHALVRDVAYGQLTLADRAAKHAALAGWLEERTRGRTEDVAEILAYHYGTALDLATSCGLDDLEDELAEPTTHYLELAGGRAAPLDAAAAAAHFARAERVADEAAKPKRRWLLSRRARRTLRRRAPLLVAAAAVIAVAAVAALAIYEFRPSGTSPASAKPPDLATMSAAQIAEKYGPAVTRVTVRVPSGVDGKLTWRTKVGSGFVVDETGTIFTDGTLTEGGYQGQLKPPIFAEYMANWARVEFWGANGEYTRVRGFILGYDTNYGGAFIAVDPAKVHLVPLAMGDPATARIGAPVFALSRQRMELQDARGQVSGVWHTTNGDTGLNEFAALRVSAKFTGPGNGGPLLDSQGRVVGVVSNVPFNLSSGTTANVVSINQYLADLRWYTKAYWGRSTWLAGSVTAVTGVARKLGLPSAHGVLVSLVFPGGAAEKSGLRGGVRTRKIDGNQYVVGGDFIVSIDGRAVNTTGVLHEILNSHRPGDVVKVRAYVGPEYRIIRTFRVKLDKFPYTPPKA